MLNEKCVFSEDEKCRALILGRRRCPWECSFFKTEKQLAESTEKTNETLRSLPFKRQIHIADKYYEGEMPWRK